MATKPTPGGSDGTYGTEMNAFLDVGHDSDGTHKKSQMLTDMEWSPTDYTNDGSNDSRESVTFPNGMIMKTGRVTTSGGNKTITYDTAFPNGAVSVMITVENTAQTSNGAVVESFSASQFVLDSANVTAIHWFAIGH